MNGRCAFRSGVASQVRTAGVAVEGPTAGGGRGGEEFSATLVPSEGDDAAPAGAGGAAVAAMGETGGCEALGGL